MKYIYIPDIKLKKAINEELVKLLGKREMLQDITDDEIFLSSIIQKTVIPLLPTVSLPLRFCCPL